MTNFRLVAPGGLNMLPLMSESEQKLRVLFVCTQNKVRSLTAEHLYRARPDLEVKSCGTANFAKTQFTQELLNWAEVIFVADDSQVEFMKQKFGADATAKPVVNLGLPDIFTYKSDALVVKLTAKLDPYLGRPTAKRCPRSAVQKLKQLAADTAGASQSSGDTSFVTKLLVAVGVKRKKKTAAG
ncbi:MAG: hypothetical protein QM813_26080 [Verrucomicrobiota bacterium]